MPSSEYPKDHYGWLSSRVAHSCQQLQASLDTEVEAPQWEEELLFLGGTAALLECKQASEKIQESETLHLSLKVDEIKTAFEQAVSLPESDAPIVFTPPEKKIAEKCSRGLRHHRADKKLDLKKITAEVLPRLSGEHFDEIRGILEQCENISDSEPAGLRELDVMAECYFYCISDWGAAPSWIIEKLQERIIALTETKVFEVNDEMREIFLEEAAELQEAIGESLNGEVDLESVKDIQRHLHTLKGGARMVGYTQVGDYIHEMEKLYEMLVEDSGYRHAKNWATLQEVQLSLNTLVLAVEKGALPEDLSTEISALQKTELTETPKEVAPPIKVQATSIPKEESASIDPELIEIYEEEAAELLEMLDGALEQWKSDLTNMEPIQAIKRDLHTLKGGARMIGQKQIGEDVHALEQQYEQIEAEDKVVDSAAYQELIQVHDNIKAAIAGMRNDAEESPVKSAETKAAQVGMKKQRKAPPKQKSRQSIRVPMEAMTRFNRLISVATIARTQVESDVGLIEKSVNQLAGDLMAIKDLQEEIKSNLLQAGSMSEGVREIFHNMNTMLSGMIRNNEHTRDTLYSTEGLLFDARHAVVELQRGLTDVQLVPFASVIPRLERIVEQLCEELSKKINFVCLSSAGEIDRQTLEGLIPPLEHMLRNAIDHGVDTPENRLKMGKEETGTINLSLRREGSNTLISFKDDGRGINVDGVRKKAIAKKILDPKAKISDQEVLRFILQPGFSTTNNVTQVSGRGVGMDVVNSDVEKLGGALLISTEKGLGTAFTIVLPFTQALSEVLLFTLNTHWYSIQANNIEGIIRVPFDEAIAQLESDDDFEYKGGTYSFRYLGSLLHDDNKPANHYKDRVMPVILLKIADTALAVLVDHVIGSRKVVMKSTGPQLQHIKEFSGACVLPNGRIVLILDAGVLENMVLHDRRNANAGLHATQAQIMIVDDSITVRKMTKKLLDKHSYTVIPAKDGLEGVELMKKNPPSLVLLDVDMPRMNGYEVASAMKTDDALKNIPIIMISSRNSDSHREQADNLGVNKVLTKPYQETALIGMIQTLLGE